jgi:hypothetical protein
MDVLALILACSVYPDDSLVRAMVELASQGNPNFVGDLSTLATFDQVSSLADAERVVIELDRQGGRPVVGLLGLPPAWAKRYGRSRSELYDGCVNLWIGTAVLAGHYDACVTAHAAMFGPTKSPSKQQAQSGGRLAQQSPRQGQQQGIAPIEAVRLCALRRFGNELGVDGYAEAVNRLLPRQRVLFNPVTPAVASWAGSPPRRADDNACHCDQDCRNQYGNQYGNSDGWLSFPDARQPRPRPVHLPPAPILD